MSQTKIIHVDMDCFYAAVEMRDNPSLKGKPIAVGGKANARGVLSTCNYEARKFGLHSAMPTSTALRKCPHLILVDHHFEKYREASYQIHEIFAQFTDKIEPLSLDEAYLDVSHHPSATVIAKQIQHLIYQKTNLTASAGVAPNKFLAKVASDWNKPNGLFVITPSDIDSFIKKLPIDAIGGVGKVTAAKLNSLGIENCSHLQQFSQEKLVEMCGKLGDRLYDICRGVDNRPVITEWIRKSLSLEQTYADDLLNLDECIEQIPTLLIELKRRFNKWIQKNEEMIVDKFFVKIKFNDFQISTTERRMPEVFFEDLHTSDSKTILEAAKKLMSESYQRGNKSVRLLGLGLRFGEYSNLMQLKLPLDERACLQKITYST